MLKNILIVGSKGAMGRRYGAVLSFLGVRWEGIDIGETPKRPYDGVIIATPTANHIDDIQYYATDAAVLCEKPFAISLPPVKEICRMAKDKGWSLRMVNQYAYLDPAQSSGESLYDYYNHGRDGLAWDCINIVGLARGKFSLGEVSPVWACMLNGHTLKIRDMDSAYIAMIHDWVSGGEGNIPYILSAHTKVSSYLGGGV
jgi:hypothetical protein